MENPPDSPTPLPQVVVAGHLCLDLIPDLSRVPAGQFNQLFKPGRMVEAGGMTFATGGAASNCGQALHRLGLPVRIAAKVGRDPFGEIVRALIGQSAPGLEQGIQSTPDAPTSYTIIASAPGLDRTFLHCTGANDTFGAEDVDTHTLEGAALLHFGYPELVRRFHQRGGRELVELFRRARRCGASTSLDMSLPDPAGEAGQADYVEILSAALPHTSLFLPSFEEALFALRRKTYAVLDEAAGGAGLLRLATPELLHSLTGQMLEMGAGIAGLKLGERGFYLRTAGQKTLASLGRAAPADLAAWADQVLWAPAYRVSVAGTTGAGDSAIAGFIGGLLRGLGPRQALSMAAAVGACNVEAPDAVSGLLSWPATQARIAAGWPQHDLALDAEDWEWDAQTGVWVFR